MNKRALPEWANDIPLLDDTTQRMSERAVHLAMLQQAQDKAAELAHIRRVLAPEMRAEGQPYAATKTGIRIGSAHVRTRGADYGTALHGPYRRHRLRNALRRLGTLLTAGATCVVLAVVLVQLSGCSPASDSQIDELVALDLADAVAQARLEAQK